MTDPGRPAATADPPADLAEGAFSNEAPWIVDRSTISWLPVVPSVRAEVRASLPDLVRARRLPPGTRVFRVVRLLGTALLGWVLVERRAGPPRSTAGISRRLRRAVERLGPTYIKLGQIISSGEGIFPEELVLEFRKCRDQVPPEPFPVVRDVVEAELGRPLHEVFASFDRRPLAAASIAQVHAATLRTGEAVVVKVQRPSVGRLVHLDLKVMAWLAPYLVGRIPIAALANPPALVDLFAETITEELDFRLEAANMLDVAKSFADLGQRGYVIPRPHPTLVTPRVLVMERLSGFAFDDVAGMQDAGLDTVAVVRTGMVGFMEGCMIHGIFHGDLHGGNLMVLADGRTALLDFGITGRLGEQGRLAFLRLLVGATMSDIPAQVMALRDLGALPADVDVAKVIADLGLDQAAIDPTTLTPEQLTGEIQRIMKALIGSGARMPKELMLFVKNMVFLDGAIATLAPDLDLFAEIAEIATYFATAHGERIAAEVGMEPDAWKLDTTNIKGAFGVDPDSTDSLTYRELQQRRVVLRTNYRGRTRTSRRKR